MQIEAGATGDPASGAAGPGNGFAHEGRLHRSGATLCGRQAGLGAAEVQQFKTAAAAIEALAHHQAEGLLRIPIGNKHLGGQGAPGRQGMEQLLWPFQQQGPLQQRLQIQEGGVLEQGHVPAP